jgi:adenylate kinase
MKRRVILLGPPGSGKGTVAARVQREFGIPHVSSGHLLRREAELGTAIGLKVRLFLEKGELVADDVVLEFMGAWMRTARLDDGFMLDGFPRTMNQARALDRWLEECSLPVEAGLLFDCELETVLERITGRRCCVACGRVYHVKAQPPKTAGHCDECGGELTQREDDTESVMRRRFAIYAELTKPVADYYERLGKLSHIGSAGSVEERFAKAASVLA